jgi:hypothetical protein
VNNPASAGLFHHSHERGLASRELTIEEIFGPTTLALIDT